MACILLAALAYYKLDPERRVLSAPFAFMAAPLVILLAYLVAWVVGLAAGPVSVVVFILALADLVGTVWHARCLLPHTQVN